MPVSLFGSSEVGMPSIGTCEELGIGKLDPLSDKPNTLNRQGRWNTRRAFSKPNLSSSEFEEKKIADLLDFKLVRFEDQIQRHVTARGCVLQASPTYLGCGNHM